VETLQPPPAGGQGIDASLSRSKGGREGARQASRPPLSQPGGQYGHSFQKIGFQKIGFQETDVEDAKDKGNQKAEREEVDRKEDQEEEVFEQALGKRA
jgi:hypothetical protein